MGKSRTQGGRGPWQHLSLVAVVAAVSLVVPATAAPAGGETQQNMEASVIQLAVPSADRCVVYDVRADVIDFVNHDQPTMFGYSFGVFDNCTNTWLAVVNPRSSLTLDESQWSVSPGLKGADLTVTAPGVDVVNGVDAPTTLHLHWEGSRLPLGTATVTGIVSSNGFTAVLDDSITWNRWGSPEFPWAGLWQCRSAFNPVRVEGGCLGQT